MSVGFPARGSSGAVLGLKEGSAEDARTSGHAVFTHLNLDIQSLSCALAVILEYSKPRTEQTPWFFLLSVTVIHLFKGTGVLVW